MKNPANFLKEARKGASLTLEAVVKILAEKGLELSPGQLSRLERGKSDILVSWLRQLGQIYKWTPGQLLDGKQDLSLRQRSADASTPFETQGQSGAPILDAGRLYVLTLWMGGKEPRTRHARIVRAVGTNVTYRDEKTGKESTINVNSPTFGGAEKIEQRST